MRRLLCLTLFFPLGTLLALRAGAALTGLSGISAFASGAGPVLVVATLAIGFSLTSFLLGAVTGDYSWVDRLWSTAPVAFAWVYAARAEYAPGAVLAAVLVTLWGLRLTYNFARRGGYTRMEDYRWPILRTRITNPVLWQLFNLLFISGFQVLLFVLFTLPVYRLGELGSIPPGVAIASAVVFLGFLSYETIADQQQWLFQSIKHGRTRPPVAPGWFGRDESARCSGLDADLRRGFLTHGLFRFSRHPNYFGELGVWWTIYLLAAVQAGAFVLRSGIGAVLLTALFIGSTAFTESISSSRYPSYGEYRRRTPAIVPWIPGAPADSETRAAAADGRSG